MGVYHPQRVDFYQLVHLGCVPFPGCNPSEHEGLDRKTPKWGNTPCGQWVTGSGSESQTQGISIHTLNTSIFCQILPAECTYLHIFTKQGSRIHHMIVSLCMSLFLLHLSEAIITCRWIFAIISRLVLNVYQYLKPGSFAAVTPCSSCYH